MSTGNLQEPSQNFVSAKDESIRMFENPFLDFMSRVHWSIPVIVYLPVITYFSYISFQNQTFSIGIDLLILLSGLFLWTVFEYLAHRFIFHFHPTSEFGKKLHFIMHGVHHDYPNDSWRLVMPPPLSLPLAILFYFIFIQGLGLAFGAPLYAGFVLGYLSYDMIHYATHHAKFIKFKWFLQLKKYHMDHHFLSPEEGFGVSNPLWDYVFGTTFKKNKK